jgi:alkylation response protein AidB-like acyl-CoA dehydrogenase
MDFDLTDVEHDVQSSVSTLLRRHAGAARAKELVRDGAVDTQLADELAAVGMLDLFNDPDGGPSAAGLVAELVSEAAGLIPIGARSLVAPALTAGHSLPAIVAIADEGSSAPVRFAADADAMIVVGETEARWLVRGDWIAEPQPGNTGYPLARTEVNGTGVTLGVGSAELARRWWRTALAVEIAGTARAAFDLTLRYVKEREQFGRIIGSFQALQHRLAECAARVDGAHWLAREAVALGAPAELSAAAAIAACQAAQLVMLETHQITGAMGFTVEYDLHVWSLRLTALRVEAGGIGRHAEALVTARWF